MYNSKTQINVLSTAWQAPDDTVGAATTQSARKQSAFRAQKFSVGDACFRQQLRRKVSTDCELLHRNSEVPPRRKGSWCNLISSVAPAGQVLVKNGLFTAAQLGAGDSLCYNNPGNLPVNWLWAIR